MSRILRRYFLPRKEKRRFINDASKALSIHDKGFWGCKPKVEVIEISKYKVFILNGRSILAQSKNIIIPTLLFDQYLNILPSIVVDMGSIPYLCKGADIMAPGIVSIGKAFREAELVVVLDERNRKPIAIARSICSSEVVRDSKKGRLFINLHHVGDQIWEAIKDLEHERKS